jgi:hypothetical protein
MALDFGNPAITEFFSSFLPIELPTALAVPCRWRSRSSRRRPLLPCRTLTSAGTVCRRHRNVLLRAVRVNTGPRASAAPIPQERHSRRYIVYVFNVNQYKASRSTDSATKPWADKPGLSALSAQHLKRCAEKTTPPRSCFANDGP